MTPELRSYLEGSLAAMEQGQLNPPADLRSPLAWDKYTENHWRHGHMERGLMDSMASDPSLPELFRKRGARTILCVGNGLSNEAVALALMGFQVESLDIAPILATGVLAAMRDAGHPFAAVPGFRVDDDGTVRFGADDTAIDATLCPNVHASPGQQYRGGGSLRPVTGDLFDVGVCPGPYDVVIERRTLQLYRGADQRDALACVIGRLGDPGCFVSQQHLGCWRPGEPRDHFAEGWLSARGISVHMGHLESAPRMAHLFTTSG